MTTIILTVAIFGLFFAMLCVRLIFLKNGEFKGTCASQNPELMAKGVDCGCGKKAGTCSTAMDEKAVKASA